MFPFIMDNKLALADIEKIKLNLNKIPETHHQQALNDALYHTLLGNKPKPIIIKNLLELGAHPTENGILLAYRNPEIFDLILKSPDIEIPSILVEQIINDKDLKSFAKVKPFLHKMKLNIPIPKQFQNSNLSALGQEAHGTAESTLKEVVLPNIQYSFMELDFNIPFIIDHKKWSNVSQYLMFKLYQGTPKAEAIKNASSVKEARRIFNIKRLKTANTAKEMMKNKTLSPIAESKFNKTNLAQKNEIFYDVNYQKFIQNNLIKNELINSGKVYIIDKDPSSLGYEGNLLGNTLMRIRATLGGNTKYNIIKTNNLTIKKYGENKYVIRGDPDDEILYRIKNMKNITNPSKGVIYSKLNFNLAGGPGWLVPKSQGKEAKQIVFDTLPDSEKISCRMKKWLKQKIRKILNIADKIAFLKGSASTSSDDIMFSIKLLGCGIFLGKDYGIPEPDFINMVNSVNGKEMSDVCYQILWNALGDMVKIGFAHDTTLEKFEILQKEYNDSVLNRHPKPVKGIKERSVIFINAFNNVYKQLKENFKDNTLITTLNILLGNKAEEVKKLYNEKVKKKIETGLNEEQAFQKFGIKNTELKNILIYLDSLGLTDKKIKLLILISLDYILSFEDIDLLRNLLLFI